MAGTIDIIACDFSFRRPGFALLQCDPEKRTVTVQETSNINNKGKNKCDGEILSEIARELRRYLEKTPDAVIVRERALDKQRGFNQKSRTIEVLHKVVGVADLYVWAFGCKQFDEIDPKAIKSVVADNPTAEKQEVADALEKFVGQREYECDDESDAVAVGIAWLLIQDMIDDPYAKDDAK